MHSSRTTTRLRARTALPALGVVLALLLAGCSGADDGDSGGRTQDGTPRTTDGKTLQATWPLTGLPVRGTAPVHPPVVVKIDNTEASQPQEGLGKADLITEELVEGGLTRLAVFFDTMVPTLVGPVRSMRASDIGLVKPVHGVVVTSGAAVPTIRRLKRAKVDFRSEDGGSAGFYRESARVAPYNLMNRLPVLVKTLKPATKATPPYLPWGSAAAFAGMPPATSITVRFGGGHTTLWSYQGGHYVNTDSNADKASQFRPDTVVVVRVAIKDAGYTDPAGNFVPESVTTGGGVAAVFHGGKVLKGTWSKSAPTAGWRFKDASGATMTIPAGHTWMEILPMDAKGGSLSYQG